MSVFFFANFKFNIVIKWNTVIKCKIMISSYCLYMFLWLQNMQSNGLWNSSVIYLLKLIISLAVLVKKEKVLSKLLIHKSAFGGFWAILKTKKGRGYCKRAANTRNKNIAIVKVCIRPISFMVNKTNISHCINAYHLGLFSECTLTSYSEAFCEFKDRRTLSASIYQYITQPIH